MPPTTILETARRIAELARRGEGGERINATKLLGDFMAKHNITEGDLESLETRDYRFDVEPNREEFLLVAQCINSTADVKVYTIMRRKDDVVVQVGAELTPVQHAEVCMKIAVLLPLFREERKTFLGAFIIANELWSKGERTTELTPEQREERMRAERMGRHVKRGAIHKALGTTNEG